MWIYTLKDYIVLRISKYSVPVLIYLVNFESIDSWWRVSSKGRWGTFVHLAYGDKSDMTDSKWHFTPTISNLVHSVSPWRTLGEGSSDAHCGYNQEWYGLQLGCCYLEPPLGRSALTNFNTTERISGQRKKCDGRVYESITASKITWQWVWERCKLLME